MTKAEYDALPEDHQRRVDRIMKRWDGTLAMIRIVPNGDGPVLYGFDPHMEPSKPPREDGGKR